MTVTSHPKTAVTRGELQRAQRRALAIFDAWQRSTGCLDDSYLGELEGIVEDAVEIGVQCAYGIRRDLESEK